MRAGKRRLEPRADGVIAPTLARAISDIRLGRQHSQRGSCSSRDPIFSSLGWCEESIRPSHVHSRLRGPPVCWALNRREGGIGADRVVKLGWKSITILF